jgi:hypothetical protein
MMQSPFAWILVFVLLMTAQSARALTTNSLPRRAFVGRAVATLWSTATVGVLPPSNMVHALDDLAMPSTQDAKDLDEVGAVSELRGRLSIPLELDSFTDRYRTIHPLVTMLYIRGRGNDVFAEAFFLS